MKNKIGFRRLGLGAAIAALFMTGCWQKSVEPFYFEKDLMTDPRLVGVWVEPDSEKPAGWTFSQRDEQSYALKIVDADSHAEFEARLFKIKGEPFLDLFSKNRSMSEIPAHHLLKVRLDENELELRILSQDWMKKWLELHPKTLAHLWLRDPEEPDNSAKKEAVLTAKTAELQKFINEHLSDEGFFEDAAILRRSGTPSSHP